MEPKNSTIQVLKNHANAFLTASLPYLETIFTGLFANNPSFQLAIHESIGLFGYYMALKQEEVNSFVQELMNHPDIYRKEIVVSKEFRDGFVISFENYLKARSKKKKQLIQSILLGFTSSIDKEKFELERLQDTILRISPEALDLLVFLKKEILPLMRENVEKEMKSYKSTIPEEAERLLDVTWQRQSVSSVIMKWIYYRYNSNSPSVKKQYNLGSEHNPELSAKIAAIEHKIAKEKTGSWPELSGLGIFRMNVTGGLVGEGAGSNFHITDFGLRFLDYISNTD